jgi:hypothetical protein
MDTLLAQLKKEKTYRYLGLIIAWMYGLIYYWSTGYVIMSSSARFDVAILKKWQSQLFNMRAPFLWEPVMNISLPFGMSLLVSPVNVVVMALLIVLVFLNVFILILSIKKPTVCKLRNKHSGILALIPALFTGFACCAPTFIVAFIGIIGSTASIFMLFSRWALPLSILLLLFGITSGIKSLQQL